MTNSSKLSLGGFAIIEDTDSSQLTVGTFFRRDQSDQENPTTSSAAQSPPNAIHTADKNSPSDPSNASDILANSTDRSEASSQDPKNVHGLQRKRSSETTRELNVGKKIRRLEGRLLGSPSSNVGSTSQGATTQASVSSKATANRLIDEDNRELVEVRLDPSAFTSDSTNDTTGPSTANTPTRQLSNLIPLSHSLPKKKRKKCYPKKLPYKEILSGVVFALSGFVNPTRSKIRDLAIRMGARYRREWDDQCTHLICAFKNTPKYQAVMLKGGRIMREHWIIECSTRKELLDWRDYKLGDQSNPDSEEEYADDLDFVLERAYGIDPSDQSGQSASR